MIDTKIIFCPMTFNIPESESAYPTSQCAKDGCAWWSEDAQKCAILVLAETQRKAVKV